MRVARFHRGLKLAALVSVTALIGAACGSSNSSSSTTSTTTSTTQSTSAAGGDTTGVTSNQITVGNVSILTGPVPGLFQGAPYGAEAFFAYINSLGGVNGRKIVLKSADDAFQCSQNQSETQALSTQVLGFVGSFSLFDNCGARIFQTNPTIPDVAYSLDPVAQALPNNFSPEPVQHGWRTGPLVYYKQQFPNDIKSVGALVANVPSSIASWKNQEAAMTSLGYHVTYVRYINPLETDFTSDIERMRSAGVKAVMMTEADVKTSARVLNAAQQQNWHPQFISMGPSYDGSFFQLVNPGAAEGILLDNQYALFLGQDRNTTPEVNLFLTWMNKTHPGFAPDLFSVFAWASARLFVQALKAAGPSPTRQSVLAALKNIHSFDSNGLVAPADPASKKPPTQWVLVRVHNGQFQRYADPPKGYRTDGGYYVNPNPPTS
jgi:ABC-type branched-subunit amino acid transport system substrate-binding protein